VAAKIRRQQGKNHGNSNEIQVLFSHIRQTEAVRTIARPCILPRNKVNTTSAETE
jgi:hypothetical protein